MQAAEKWLCGVILSRQEMMHSSKSRLPFQPILDELFSIRPVVRKMFGFTYVYFDEKLLISIRESTKQPRYNGVWVYTEAEHIESLRREFPSLPRNCFWRSKKSGSGWVIVPASLPEFEEYAFKVCELILRSDKRI